MKNLLIDVVKGMLIGIANIIPGVSGGTMAVALGIYDKIVNIIGNIFHSIFKDFKNTFKLLFPLAVGCGIGVLAFSKIIGMTLEQYNMQTIFTFIGLILGTIPLVFASANKNGFKKIYIVPCVITFVFMVALLFLPTSQAMVFSNTFSSYFLLFGLGVLAAITMVVPGISGSFVLMLIGAYAPILALVNNLQIVLLIPFGLGVVAGIIVASKIIDLLLNKWYGGTYYTIIGFILGSFILIFRNVIFTVSAIIPSIICLILGFIASYFLSKKLKQ